MTAEQAEQRIHDLVLERLKRAHNGCAARAAQHEWDAAYDAVERQRPDLAKAARS